MNKLLEHLIVFLLAANIIAGCASAPIAEGQVIPLQPSATMQGIRAALNAAPGTAVLWKDNLTLVVWRVAEGFGFACFDCSVGDPIALFFRLTGGKGNYVLPKTMSEITSALKQNGWQEVLGGIPTTVQTVVSSGAPVIGIMILPIGVIPEEAWTVQQ